MLKMKEFEIIGEWINRIITAIKNFEIKITKAKAIISLRNQVVSYDTISDENIWSILTNHLPKLKRKLNI
jgi:uncharacterized protein with HEPN domain